MKKILLSALPLLAMIAVSCEKSRVGNSEDDPIEFKDPNFLNALLTYDCAYGEDSEHPICLDANNDGRISFSEAKKVKTLVLTALNDETAESYNIEDISEIRYFTELTGLICDDNRLTSLDVSNNTALELLDLNDNQLTSLDLSNNAKLVVLNCDRNQLATLDVSNNTALAVLSLADNQLATIDFGNNEALQYMCCDNNKLTTLNLSKNAALVELACENNQLTSLDLSGNALLETLYCDGNQLKKIILSAENSLPESFIKHIIKEYGEIVEYK